ncbi:MAG TPA: flagellar motor protein MotD [Rhodanobacteraceae bacterium]|nr:flagellar motor protein MotD [Oleiagrimonas sp.]HET9819504.1 flagellar motor protein MotD [Rhodanobacteraceae bacterium]
MRKRHHEEHVDSEKWAIPYADLMTLLLAFFVVMYSLSSINEAKFRVLAESINEAFNGTGKVVQPITPAQPARQVPLPDKYRAANATPIARIRVPVPPRHLPVPGHEGAASEPSPGTDIQMAGAGSAGADIPAAGPGAASDDAKMADLKTISTEVAKALKPWVDRKQVVIRQTKLWLEIEIRTDVLFPSGVAMLTDPARNVLDGVAGVLARFSNPIRIEGYTDNRPIDTWKFPSNWELSAARAGSVARLFGDQGVDPRRIGIFGWGEYHPVASNATPDGRNRNRRIAIVLLSDQAAQRRYDHNDNRSVASAHSPAALTTRVSGAASRDSASTANAATDTAPTTQSAPLRSMR